MKLSLTLLAIVLCISPAVAFVPLAPVFGRGTSASMAVSSTTSVPVTKEDLLGARDMIDGILDEKNCGPVFVRLAWHDSGTFDANIKGDWPSANGAIGSIRFEPEILHGANKGLSGAVKLLEPVKEKFPEVSYADIYQMASARAIELAGGPKIDMK